MPGHPDSVRPDTSCPVPTALPPRWCSRSLTTSAVPGVTMSEWERSLTSARCAAACTETSGGFTCQGRGGSNSVSASVTTLILQFLSEVLFCSRVLFGPSSEATIFQQNQPAQRGDDVSRLPILPPAEQLPPPSGGPEVPGEIL